MDGIRKNEGGGGFFKPESRRKKKRGSDDPEKQAWVDQMYGPCAISSAYQ